MSFFPIISQKEQQEAQGPRLAHLSEIATADLQILCNIFPILSLQLIKGSSFEQVLVLKKKNVSFAFFFCFFFIIIILPYMGMTVNEAYHLNLSSDELKITVVCGYKN